MSSTYASGSRPGERRALEHLGRGDSLVFLGGEAAGEDRLGDQGQRHAQVARRDDGPFSGALLAGGIEDQVDHRPLGLGVGEAQDVAGDLDQVAVERALVPAVEDVVDGCGSKPSDLRSRK